MGCSEWKARAYDQHIAAIARVEFEPAGSCAVYSIDPFARDNAPTPPPNVVVNTRSPAAIALVWFVAGNGFTAWSGAAILLGAGTALVYPTLIAAVGDYADPSWRAGATGVYRFWRDAGYLFGALLAGVTADVAGIPAAIGMVAALTAAAGLDSWINLASRRSAVKA